MIDGTVTLIKTNWDGDISRDNGAIWEVMYHHKIAVEKRSCRAEEAYETLIALTEDSSKWKGAAVEYSRDPLAQLEGFSNWA